MKKIIAFLIALMMTASLMFNVYKASAVAVPAGYLAYLIEAVTEMLVGSGTCTQAQIRDMNTSELFETAKGVAPSIDWDKNAQMKANVIENVNKFINDVQLSSLAKSGLMENIVDWIYGNANTLAKINPELKGYGAMGVVEIYSKSDNSLANTSFYFGDYGIIKKGFFADIYGDVIIRQYFVDGVKLYEDEYSGSFTLGGAFAEDNYILPKVKFVGDWRYPDGTPATDMLTFVQEVPEAIGTVDIDGTTYDVNGDGTVTIDDKTIPINDDGSVTVDGKPYNPDYDVSPYPGTSIGDLITTIINNIDVTEDTDTDLIDEVEIEVPQEIADSELSSLTMPKTIATVFPFCIPWDFYNGIKLLSAEPEAPYFEVPFEIPEYKSFPGFKKMIVVDFSKYSSAFAVVRWTMFAMFMFGLCFITFKIVKGV